MKTLALFSVLGIAPFCFSKEPVSVEKEKPTPKIDAKSKHEAEAKEAEIMARFDKGSPLIADVSLNIDEKNIVCTMSIVGEKLISYKMDYLRNQVGNKKFLTTTMMPDNIVEEISIEETFGTSFDEILNLLKPITYSDIVFKVELKKDAEGMVNGEILESKNSAKLPLKDAQKALSESLKELNPKDFEETGSALYVYALAAAYTEHEAVKQTPQK